MYIYIYIFLLAFLFEYGHSSKDLLMHSKIKLVYTLLLISPCLEDNLKKQQKKNKVGQFTPLSSSVQCKKTSFHLVLMYHCKKPFLLP